jgi:hypothetical protein
MPLTPVPFSGFPLSSKGSSSIRFAHRGRWGQVYETPEVKSNGVRFSLKAAHFRLLRRIRHGSRPLRTSR